MRSRYRECEAKKRYADEHRANREADRCMRARGDKLSSYYCGFCEGWHLTRITSAPPPHRHEPLRSKPATQVLAVLPPQVRNAYAPGDVTGARLDMTRGFEIVVTTGKVEHVWRFEHPRGGWCRQ